MRPHGILWRRLSPVLGTVLSQMPCASSLACFCAATFPRSASAIRLALCEVTQHCPGYCFHALVAESAEWPADIEGESGSRGTPSVKRDGGVGVEEVPGAFACW